MIQLAVGLLILGVWGVVTFVVHPGTGWIHVGLIGGVLLVIRGIVTLDEARDP
ncbi:MAG TPA: hypothetical protein VFN22_11045 [Gemmatimonadales bacterium]|nr:hypothetical protein [Gemmatimonadales bacterium]